MNEVTAWDWEPLGYSITIWDMAPIQWHRELYAQERNEDGCDKNQV